MVARKNPGPAGRTSDAIYFARGVDDLPPDASVFRKNITAKSLRAQLSTTLGISENLHVPPRTSTRPPLEASSRHAIIFCLQTQDEIVNRRLLFHRQGEPFLPQAIRDVLPYFLGAVSEDHLYALRRYQDARKRLRRLEREYTEAQAVTRDASNAARRLRDEARRAGLLPLDAPGDDVTAVLQLLTEATVPRPISFSTLDDPEADLADLDERRRSLLRQLRGLREEIADVTRMNREASRFEVEAREQEARLLSIGLVSETNRDVGEMCPLCESQLAVPVPEVSDLRASLQDVRTQLRSVRRDAPRLQERLSALATQRDDINEELGKVNADIARRISDNERLRLEQHQFTEQARVVGRIAYYLENMAAVDEDSQLAQTLDQLRAETAELESLLDRDVAEEHVMTALNLLGRDLTTFGQQLRLEHGEHPLRLDLKRLTVLADTDDGPLPLTQMGSGENWVGYHVAVHLSLHRLFRRRQRPIPGVLMLDQPSQPYYPPERDQQEWVDGASDEDREAVRQLFRVLREYCAASTPHMQIIVTDHVELLDNWFKEAIVARWRAGLALVPQVWLE